MIESMCFMFGSIVFGCRDSDCHIPVTINNAFDIECAYKLDALGAWSRWLYFVIVCFPYNIKHHLFELCSALTWEIVTM